MVTAVFLAVLLVLATASFHHSVLR